jgi:hypothetical protein
LSLKEFATQPENIKKTGGEWLENKGKQRKNRGTPSVGKLNGSKWHVEHICKG